MKMISQNLKLNPLTSMTSAFDETIAQQSVLEAKQPRHGNVSKIDKMPEISP